MSKSSKVAVLSAFVASVLLSACGGLDQDSNLDNSSKKKYRLVCLANMSYPNQFGSFDVRTVRAEGTKEYKMDKAKLVEARKEKDEYKAVLTNRITACNSLHPIMNVSGCSNIDWNKPEVLVQDPASQGQSKIITFAYSGRHQGIERNYKGEYFCQMREFTTAP